MTETCILAADLSGLPAQLGTIFYFVVLPIILLAGVGYVLQRKFSMDMLTLRRLNFYFVIPALVYWSIVSTLSGGDHGVGTRQALTVIVFGLVMLACLAAVTYIAALIRRVPRDHRRTMLMTTMFYNSGNYGLPLQGLAWRSAGRSGDAMALQIFVIIVQNFTNFTIGVLLAAGGKKDRHWKQNLLHIAKFPPIYALAAALITVQIRNWLGTNVGPVEKALEPFWHALTWVKEAFFAVALLTLGAQLARVRKKDHGYPVTLSVAIRLLVGPAIGLAVIYIAGIEGFLAQVLLISTATPTAVNCMLLCLEFDNHPDYAARAVFYSTLLSPLTVTLAVFFAQGGLLPGMAN